MKNNKIGGIALVVIGVFFMYKFKVLTTTNDTYGIVAAAIIILIGIYSVYNSSKKVE